MASSRADQTSMAVEVIEREFGDNIDFFDFNCGCPIDTFCKKGMCAELLRRPTKAISIIRALTMSSSLAQAIRKIEK